MSLRDVAGVVVCVLLASPPARAAAASGGPLAKADQEVIRQAAKAGLSAQQVRELTAAVKRDRSICEAVKSALDKGMRAGELAEHVQKEIEKRQGMMGQGQGMMGQGQVIGRGMGMGRGMMRGMGMGRMRGGR